MAGVDAIDGKVKKTNIYDWMYNTFKPEAKKDSAAAYVAMVSDPNKPTPTPESVGSNFDTPC
ncbi:hypothetical protein IJI31_05040 [bacterium]|nr:hypothetical protein [bacterium]